MTTASVNIQILSHDFHINGVMCFGVVFESDLDAMQLTYGSKMFEFLLSDSYVNVALLVVCSANKILC